MPKFNPEQELQIDWEGTIADAAKAAEQELDATMPSRNRGDSEIRLAGFEPLTTDAPLQPGEYVMPRGEHQSPAASMSRLKVAPEAVPPAMPAEAAAAELSRRPLADEQVDRFLIEIIRNSKIDPRRTTALVAKHREDARRMMEDGTITPADAVSWLTESIRMGERKISGVQQAMRAEREFVTDSATLVQAARYAELAKEEDRRARDLGALGLLADMAATELKSSITDPRVQDIAEDLKPLLDNWLRLLSMRPDNAVASLREAVRMAVKTQRLQYGEETEAQTAAK